MAEYIYHKQNISISNIEKYTDFKQKVSECLFNDGLSIPDGALLNLMIHIEVMLNRIEGNHFIGKEEIDKDSLKQEYEYLVATDIADIIYEMFHIKLNELEKAYLTIHLLGKKVNSISSVESCMNSLSKPKLDELISMIIRQIKYYFGIDFDDDYYLKKALRIHLVPMIDRLKSKTYLRNPLLQQIKEKYSFAYFISVEAWNIINKDEFYISACDEIAYIALHFQYAIERRKRRNSKKKVVLINDYCTSSTELLSFSLIKKYGQSIEIVKTIFLRDIETYDFSDCDYALTTGYINTSLPVKTLNIESNN